jgi:hypothetical protein
MHDKFWGCSGAELVTWLNLQHNIGCFAGQLSASCGVGSQALLSEHSTIGQSLWSADGCLTAEFTNAAAFWNLTAHTHLQKCSKLFPAPCQQRLPSSIMALEPILHACLPAQHSIHFTRDTFRTPGAGPADQQPKHQDESQRGPCHAVVWRNSAHSCVHISIQPNHTTCTRQ